MYWPYIVRHIFNALLKFIKCVEQFQHSCQLIPAAGFDIVRQCLQLAMYSR